MRDNLRQAISTVRELQNYYLSGRHHDARKAYGLELALTELRQRAKMEEDTENIAEQIGNCYIPHLNRTENDFEQGYNSAIRDVLDILLKEKRYQK